MPTQDQSETLEQVVEVTQDEVIEPEPQVEEEFDKERAMDTIKKLRAFEKQAKQQEKKLAAYEEAEEKRKQAEMSEMERLQVELEKSKSELVSAKLLEQKRQAASKHGIPEALISRLQGDTVEEMEADAANIAALLKEPKKVPPNLTPTNPSGNSAISGETPADRNRRLGIG